jgi:hypothetical protein
MREATTTTMTSTVLAFEGRGGREPFRERGETTGNLGFIEGSKLFRWSYWHLFGIIGVYIVVVLIVLR